MGLETNSDYIGVRDYFVNPIQHQKIAQKCLIKEHSSGDCVGEANLSKYLNEKAISEMIKVNSEVGKILGAFKIPIRINLKILNNLIKKSGLIDLSKIFKI